MSLELSVVIPTRNRWPLLKRAVATALAQRDVALEVLVIDDGSTDDSAERVEAIADRRVTVARCPHLGVAAARNYGIEHANTSWVALLDDDDLWAPEKSRRQLDALTRDDAEIAYTSQVVVDESLGFKRLLEAPAPSELLHALLGSNAIGTPSSVIARRETLMAVGGFDSSFSVLADWDMWLRLCTGRRAAACPQTLVAYVEHDTNLHMLDTDSVLREFTMLRRRHQALATRMNISLGDINWWRWIASSHRRADRRWQAAYAYLRTGVRFRSSRDIARAPAVLGGERVMRRLAQPVCAPDVNRRRDWQWLAEGHSQTPNADTSSSPTSIQQPPSRCFNGSP
jgi:glycosyltransferase involved in cell wall biosynthesis